MARARSIRPAFFRDETLCRLPAACRLLYIGLWTLADREGRLREETRSFKVQILPFDRCNLSALLGRLEGAGYIRRYTVNGVKYLDIPDFLDHQHPYKAECESCIPPHPSQASGVRERAEIAPETVIPEDLKLKNPKPESLKPSSFSAQNACAGMGAAAFDVSVQDGVTRGAEGVLNVREVPNEPGAQDGRGARGELCAAVASGGQAGQDTPPALRAGGEAEGVFTRDTERFGGEKPGGAQPGGANPAENRWKNAEKVLSLYQENCPSFTPLEHWTKPLLYAAAEAFTLYGEADLACAFARMSQSPFLRGEAENMRTPGFRADFNFCLKPEHIQGALSGRYAQHPMQLVQPRGRDIAKNAEVVRRNMRIYNAKEHQDGRED